MTHRSSSAARALAAASTLIAACAASSALAQPAPKGKHPGVERGRYLVQTTGCNDCHTAGYGPNAGKVPVAQWLQGDSLGWRGPWGTTYSTNLRLWFADKTEAQWLKIARTFEPRPPMPWFNLRAMSDSDLRAIYRFVKAAGPAGAAAPSALPPGDTPKGPFIQFPG